MFTGHRNMQSELLRHLSDDGQPQSRRCLIEGRSLHRSIILVEHVRQGIGLDADAVVRNPDSETAGMEP